MTKLFSFKGQATTKDYWHVVGIGGGALILLTVASCVAGVLVVSKTFWIVMEIVRYALLVFYTWVAGAASVKRCHDRNKSGWWMFVPYWNLRIMPFVKGARGANRYGQLVVALVAISFGTMTGCAKLLEVPEELERIDATFFYDPMSASLPSAHAVKLREQRHIRRVVIHSIDRMRNTDIYVRTGEDRWVHVKQFKGWIEGVTSVDIRVEGDAVRVIPKTHALGLIKKVEVFALPKPH